MLSLRTFVIVAMTLSLAACATIFGQSDQDIAIDSTPDGAAVTVTDEAGAQVFTGTTPSSVTLTKKRGYFQGKSFNVTISKDGYEPVEVALTPRANGWYIGGNILIGGLIGWFIVDPLTGAMWTLEPKEINQELVGSQSSMDSQQLSIYLLEEVPENRRADLVRIN